MICSDKWLIGFVLLITCVSNTMAQKPDKYLEFSLEELAAVDVVKPLSPINVDSAYVVSGSTINLGYLLPIAGYPRFTKELINAANLAIGEINAQGGVLGKKLVLIPADIGATEEAVLKRANQLDEHFNTQLFIGPTSSDGLITLSDQLLSEKDVLVVAATATSPAISTLQDRGLIFRTCPSDAVQGKQAARFCYQQLKARKAAVLYQDNFYGRTLRNVFSEQFEEEGGEILNTINFNPMINLQNYDMTQKLDSLMSGRPDVIYVISLARTFSDISHQMADKALFTNRDKPVIVMSDGARGEDLAQQGNLSVLNGMFGFYLPFTGNRSFAGKFEKLYGQKPFSLASEYTYDIVYLLALAMLEAKSTDPVAVSKHLLTVSKEGIPITFSDFTKAEKLIGEGKDINYQGITGKLDFDDSGDVNERHFARWQLIDGKIRYIN